VQVNTYQWLDAPAAESAQNPAAAESNLARRDRGTGARRVLPNERREFATIGRDKGGRAMSEQTFENHRKTVPVFHFFATPIFLINFLWSLFRLKRLGISFEGIFGVILAAALVVLVFEARLFALAVQDRVIRLEERLRYAQVLPADLQARTGALTINQIVAMRFASDAELPALVRKVLDEKLMERKAIKQLINNWKADYLRA
jgi:hypothetical protein